jgi:large subunit ribosomal protein L17
MATALIENERIVSTKAKAKALRPFLEPLVTRAKIDSVANRRLVSSVLGDKEAVKKLFDDLALRFKDRPGGYTRIIPLGQRTGDAADMAIIEFVGEEVPS